MARSSDLAPYLAQLRALPFVSSVTVEKASAGPTSRTRNDTVVTLQTPAGKARFGLEVRASNLSHAGAADVIARARTQTRTKLLVFSRYIPPAVADELAQHDVQFVDEVGNQHLRIADRYFVRASGKRPTGKGASENKSTQATGYLVYFALLADRTLCDAPIRTTAAAVGVSKSAVSNALTKLERDGLLVRRRNGAHWLDAPAVWGRWLVGYAEVVRPRLFLGGYRTQDADPRALETRLEAQMPPEIRWAFGGGAAVYRLTGHYRGEVTVVHAIAPPTDLNRTLRALRTEQQPSLILLRAPGPLLLQGPQPHTAHPLLVYTELLSTGDERAREAAAELQERYLKDSLA